MHFTHYRDQVLKEFTKSLGTLEKFRDKEVAHLNGVIRQREETINLLESGFGGLEWMTNQLEAKSCKDQEEIKSQADIIAIMEGEHRQSELECEYRIGVYHRENEELKEDLTEVKEDLRIARVQMDKDAVLIKELEGCINDQEDLQQRFENLQQTYNGNMAELLQRGNEVHELQCQLQALYDETTVADVEGSFECHPVESCWPVYDGGILEDISNQSAINATDSQSKTMTAQMQITSEQRRVMLRAINEYERRGRGRIGQPSDPLAKEIFNGDFEIQELEARLIVDQSLCVSSVLEMVDEDFRRLKSISKSKYTILCFTRAEEFFGNLKRTVTSSDRTEEGHDVNMGHNKALTSTWWR